MGTSRPARSPFGKTVLISGASTGIGLCCAQTLAEHGWRVIAGVRKAEDMSRLSEISPMITPIDLDVTIEGSIREAHAQVTAMLAGEPLHGLVNNAGIVVGLPMELVPIKMLRQQIEVNLVGHVAMTQAFLPLLRKGPGRIVNMGSVAGISAIPFMAPYSISKFALEAWTDALRMELLPWGIHVSSIQPGSIATPIWEKSRTFAEKTAGALPESQIALYMDAMESVRKAALRSASRGIPPEHVAKVVLQALSASRPKTRYGVGRGAALRRLLNLLPDRVRDRLVLWKLGLS